MVAQACKRAGAPTMFSGPYNAAAKSCEHFTLHTSRREKATLTVKEQENLPKSHKNTSADQALGLDRDITRRDFLNATLLASGGALLHSISPAQLLGQRASEAPANDEWTGYGGVGDYASSNGNTLAVLDAG